MGEMNELDAQCVLGVYSKAEPVFARGRGSWLEDESGKRYLDFVSGIAVMALGHADPDISAAIAEQASRYTQISNLFVNPPQAKLARRLLAAAPRFDKVFFCNSGTEANEAQIKFARKYWAVRGENRTRIVSFAHSFHGRTYGGLSVTGQPKLQAGFGAMLADCDCTVPWNDPKALLAAVSEKTAAILIEPIQGEGGVNPASPELVAALREAREKTGALVMVDDIQCGCGRLGTFLGSEAVGIESDMESLAKPIGGGLPLGAVLVSKRIAECLKPGDHAGLCAFQSNFCALEVQVADDGSKDLVAIDRNGDILRTPMRGDIAFLRIDYNFRDDTARMQYSFDEMTWIPVDYELKMRYTLDYFTGYRSALYNYATKELGGAADFDYFRQEEI